MRKNIFLTILICITAVSMIIGILWHVTGTIHPGRKNSAVRETVAELRDTVKEEFIDEENTDKGNKDKEEKAGGKQEQAADSREDDTGKMEYNDDLRALNMEISLGNIRVKTGKELRVDYTGDDKYRPDVSQENGILSVTQPKVQKHFNFNIKDIHAEVTVTLPEGYAFENVDIQENLGDIDIRDLTADKLTVADDLGDIDIKDCLIGDIDIAADLGDVDIDGCVFSKLYIEEDLGDVTVSTPQDLSGAALDLETDLGTVKIDGEDQGKRHTRSGNGEIKITVQNDMGDITLNSAAGGMDASR